MPTLEKSPLLTVDADRRPQSKLGLQDAAHRISPLMRSAKGRAGGPTEIGLTKEKTEEIHSYCNVLTPLSMGADFECVGVERPAVSDLMFCVSRKGLIRGLSEC
jgi:hypothetical protein